MDSNYKIERRVEFAETDMAGLMHFSNYFNYMEAAESAFFESIDEPLIKDITDSVYGWPIVSTSCDFSAPLKFGDLVEVLLVIEKILNKGLKYSFCFRKVEGNKRTEVARGEMTTLFCVINRKTGKITTQALPESLMGKLRKVRLSDTSK